MAGGRRRASRFETLGAWLRLWTPPRDVDVAPVPWRVVVLLGLPVLALAGLGTWLVLDEASESSREREALEQRDASRRAALERRRLRAEQEVQRARATPAPRPLLVRELERAILADARRRVAAGDLGRRVRRVECSPHPRTGARRAAEADPARRSGRYRCLAVTSAVVGPAEGSIGYPFLATIAYRTGALAWCKLNPVPGERVVPDPRELVRLPPECV